MFCTPCVLANRDVLASAPTASGKSKSKKFEWGEGERDKRERHSQRESVWLQLTTSLLIYFPALSYLLPLLQLVNRRRLAAPHGTPLALILTPTRELAMQVEVRTYHIFLVVAVIVNNSISLLLPLFVTHAALLLLSSPRIGYVNHMLLFFLQDQAKLLGSHLPVKTALIVGGIPVPNQLYRLRNGVQVCIQQIEKERGRDREKGAWESGEIEYGWRLSE